MNNIEYVDQINNIESDAAAIIDLLEITKIYCEANLEESERFMALSTIIRTIIKEQRTLLSTLKNAL